MPCILHFLGGIVAVVSISPNLIFFLPPPHNTLTAVPPKYILQQPTMSNKPPPMSHSDVIMTLNGMMPALDRNNPNDKAFEMARLFFHDVHYFFSL